MVHAASHASTAPPPKTACPTIVYDTEIHSVWT